MVSVFSEIEIVKGVFYDNIVESLLKQHFAFVGVSSNGLTIIFFFDFLFSIWVLFIFAQKHLKKNVNIVWVFTIMQ